jgi:hypothetical protein
MTNRTTAHIKLLLLNKRKHIIGERIKLKISKYQHANTLKITKVKTLQPLEGLESDSGVNPGNGNMLKYFSHKTT